MNPSIIYAAGLINGLVIGFLIGITYAYYMLNKLVWSIIDNQEDVPV